MSLDTNTVNLKTLGCRLNAYESAAMKELAGDAGIETAVIINTCAVTGEAVRKSRQTVRQAKHHHPEATIIVTGCAAQINPEEFRQIQGVDWVLGNDQKLLPSSWQEIARSKDASGKESYSNLVDDIMKVKELNPHMTTGFDNRVVAYVQIQNGCDHRCTFCIIPYGRGNSRSIPAGALVEQIGRLVAEGFKEVVLTGVDIASWGKDLPGSPKLGYLVARILKFVPDLQRLRLSSMDPAEIDEELVSTFADEERLMPHLHLSVQAGDNMILKRMKRRHCREDVIELCRRIRRLRPDVIFGADLIAGFPTETEAMFQNSLFIVNDCDLTWLHAFPFSPRAGTPAARMPQNNGTTIRERAARLREVGAKKVKEFFETQIGRHHSVLIESSTTGRTGQYSVVEFDGRESPGHLKVMAVTGYNESRLLGIPVDS